MHSMGIRFQLSNEAIVRWFADEQEMDMNEHQTALSKIRLVCYI